MKKIVSIILCLVIIFAAAGCGGKKSGDVVGGDTCPSICIDGVTYYDTGMEMPIEPNPSVIKCEEIQLSGSGAEGKATAWVRITDDTLGDDAIAVLINDEWYKFEAR